MSGQREAEFPEKLGVLFEPARYKVLYGGRGGAKSWGVARALLILGMQKPIRILCAREFQNSIKDSVHKLLSDQVESLGMGSFYEVQNTAIRGKNGTEFGFVGLRHNVTSVKSYEGVDVCWVEEAQFVTKSSWDTLIPTIRKPGSEIIITFNPELDTDETYVRFVRNPPPDAVVVKINYSDNPWFPDVLRAEMYALRERDPDSYLTVWEGECRQVLDGAIYANEIRRATEQGRFTAVPYDRSKPVDTFWDLGRADKTSIWFAQQVGFEYRIIDFYEDRGHPLDHYLKHLSDTPYAIGTCWLPHDAENELLASRRTIAQQMRDAGRVVQVLKRISVADGINAARTIFPNCWFDAERCAEGLNALRRYRYDVDPETGQYSKAPLHDENSHASDAFRYLALALQERAKPVIKPAFKRPALGGAGGWMAS